MKNVYLSQVSRWGGEDTRLMAYMEYLIISVMVQANKSSGKPRDVCEGGERYSMAQVTYTRENTCCTVTWTLDRTRPRAECRISSTAKVWNTWSVVLVTEYRSSILPPVARWEHAWYSRKLHPTVCTVL